MNHSSNDHRAALAPFPGQPIPRLYDRGVEVLRTRYRRFLVTPTGKNSKEVSLNKSSAAC